MEKESINMSATASGVHPYTVFDYIDRIIPTNGFISNDSETDQQFYTGYRVFVRNDLDRYSSVDEWREETGGFQDQARIMGFGHVTEYVYREMRGANDVIDAGMKGWNIDDSVLDHYDLDKKNLFRLITYDEERQWIGIVVNLHRARKGLPPLNIENLDIIEQENDRFLALIDRTSRTAQFEARRMMINEEQAYST